ncbi:hypothetical protein NEOLI_005301 [Neolecta irregularis DAH-3]|uniref:Uncharacterized protein n=1 Tax=Neolecta irregularis (strain DAH-3) TaxID=1198029 RepID=A0A1U7LKJ8_NEOID|nr:hypothetical protein NEOLI_005301 [Neolecta irregularis DAH-3]|eukprot:OLL23169.1 hypothetical protein NEOLI_005301 [Neolecta irregularis DAH-3]
MSSLSDLLELDPSLVEKPTLDALVLVKSELRQLMETSGVMSNTEFTKEIIQAWVRMKLPISSKKGNTSLNP